MTVLEYIIFYSQFFIGLLLLIDVLFLYKIKKNGSTLDRTDIFCFYTLLFCFITSLLANQSMNL